MAEAIIAARPDVVVLAAAYTNVDKAQGDKAQAMALNADAPAALAQAARRLDVPLIHISSDYVFDGEKSGPYDEGDAPSPLGVYGASKLAGEAAIAAATDNHVILRTAWVYSPFGGNFLKTMLRLAQTRDQVPVVADQRGNPTSAADIATAIIKIAGNLHGAPANSDLRGVFHLAGAGATTWADFATAIFSNSAALSGPSAEVMRITSAQFPRPAPRPKNSCLATAKLTGRHGVTLPAWEGSTQHTVARLIGADNHRRAAS